MQISPSLHSLELQISQQEAHLREEHFGDSRVEVYEDDERYPEYDRVITQLVERFPRAENGSRFINAHVEIIPQITLIFSKLQPLLSGPGIPNEVGKAINIFPLSHALVGSFTTEKTTLVIRNIRPLPGAKLESNSNVPSDVERKGIHINAESRYGYYDTDPRRMKTQVYADIAFGEYIAQDQLLELNTLGDEASTEVVIPLAAERLQIAHDGIVTRKNGHRFNISQITKNKELRWINYTWTVNVPFKINI